MNAKNEILKNFSIGFLPVAIFLLGDWLYGAMVGIAIALAFGMGELLFFYIKNNTFEKFIVFDLVLLMLFGMVSLLLENEFFFKLKPAIFELILVIILLIHGFTNKPILLIMSKRYFQEIKMHESQLHLLKTVARYLTVIFALHTFLIVWSAYFWSKEIWVFISGGLFYIIFGLLLVAQFLFLKFYKKSFPMNSKTGIQKNEEWFDIVDKNGRLLGKATRNQVHGNPDLIHPTVHVHVFNSCGLLFLQKRIITKDLYPGRWDTAVGGHVNSGETINDALVREASEELGLAIKKARPLFRYIMRNNWESELIHTFTIINDGPFILAPDEIEEGRFWSGFEIHRNLEKNIFTPNFEEEFKMLTKAGLI